MSAFGYSRYGVAFGTAVNDGGTRISDKLMEATDRLAVSLFELGNCKGLEVNFNFLYPFVGGTQVAHSFNLADPSQKRIAFEDDTTVTHNVNGITGPGNVQLFGFESASVADADTMYGLYQRSGVSDDKIDFIAQSSTNIVHGIVCRRATGGDTVYWAGVNNATGYMIVANNNPQGFYAVIRANPNAWGYKNGANVSSIGTGAAGNSGIFYLFSGNSHNISYVFLTRRIPDSGYPVDGAYIAKMYTIVQKFQTWCARAV
jgi:hypothetical protein